MEGCVMSIDPNAVENSPEYDALLDADVREDAAGVASTTREADVVRITGNAGDVHARMVNVENGGVARATSEALTLNIRNGGVGLAAANTFDALLENSGVGMVAARAATLKGGRTAFVLAGKVQLNEGARVLFDVRAGIIAGVLAGAVFGVIYGAARWMLKARTRAR